MGAIMTDQKHSSQDHNKPLKSATHLEEKMGDSRKFSGLSLEDTHIGLTGNLGSFDNTWQRRLASKKPTKDKSKPISKLKKAQDNLKKSRNPKPLKTQDSPQNKSNTGSGFDTDAKIIARLIQGTPFEHEDTDKITSAIFKTAINKGNPP